MLSNEIWKVHRFQKLNVLYHSKDQCSHELKSSYTMLWNTQKENIVCSLRCWSILSFQCAAAFHLLQILCQTLYLLQMRTFFLCRKNVSKCVCWKLMLTSWHCQIFFKKDLYDKYKLLLQAINTEMWFIIISPLIRWSVVPATLSCMH